jgi:hypothetical protein
MAVDIKHCDQTVEVMLNPSQSSAKVTVAVDIKHCDQTVEAMLDPSQSSVKVTVGVGIESPSQATPSIRRKRAASLREQDVPPSKRHKTKNHDKIAKAMVDYFRTRGQSYDIKMGLRDLFKQSLSDTRGQTIIDAFMGLSFDQVRQGLRMMLEDGDDELNSAFLSLVQSEVRIDKNLPPQLLNDIIGYIGW